MYNRGQNLVRRLTLFDAASSPGVVAFRRRKAKNKEGDAWGLGWAEFDDYTNVAQELHGAEESDHEQLPHSVIYPRYIHLDLLMLHRTLICAHTCFSDVNLFFLTTQNNTKNAEIHDMEKVSCNNLAHASGFARLCSCLSQLGGGRHSSGVTIKLGKKRRTDFLKGRNVCLPWVTDDCSRYSKLKLVQVIQSNLP